MCNRKFNVSADKEKKIKGFFQQLFLHDVDFKCRTPCTTSKFTTNLVHTIESEHASLVVAFDMKIDVVHSTFKIDKQTLMTRLGGSVSSGRTLLWILLSLLGASQVIFDTFHFFQVVHRVKSGGLMSFCKTAAKKRETPISAVA